MDAIGTAAAIVGVVSVTIQALKFLLTPGFSYRSARYGRIGTALHYLGLHDTDAVRKCHLEINRWKDEDVLAWKTSYVSSCSAIAVAGAIFATLGLTALQLPNMYETHWTARALLVLSMALGILSVVYASSQQQVIGMLNNPLEIRLWLSRGMVDLNQRGYGMPYRLFPLESSDAAIMITTFPSTLLQLAVVIYLVGFGLYILFSWLEKVDSDSIGHRNVFIVFIVAVGCLYAYRFVLFIFNVFDVQKRTREFGLDRSEDFAKPESQQQLEIWLKTLQEMQDTNIESRTDYETLEAKIKQVLADWAQQRAHTSEKHDNSGLRAKDAQARAHQLRPGRISGAEGNTDIIAQQDV